MEHRRRARNSSNEVQPVTRMALSDEPSERLDRYISWSSYFELTSAGVVTIDTSGIVVDCNASAVRILGVERDEVLDRPLFDERWNPVHENGSSVTPNDDPVLEALRTGQSTPYLTVGVNVAKQSRLWLWLAITPIREGESVKGLICSFRDISDRLRRELELTLLTGVNRFVMSKKGTGDPLQFLCDVLVERGHYPLAWIGEALDDDQKSVEIAYHAGLTDYLYEGMVSWSESRPNGNGPAGRALRSDETQVVNDMNGDPLYEPWLERPKLCSIAAIPFHPDGRRCVLVVYTWHSVAFAPESVKALEDIVREVEFGVSHSNSVSQLALTLNATLSALGRMTEFRDRYTAGHQLHVGELGSAIGTHLGLDKGLTELIRQAGEVHDVGKIAVPLDILSRPGQLNKNEFEIIKEHTIVGADILTQASLPWPIAEVALQHHERLDGSGYPNGLSGEEISLPARIIAVADVVEAITQHRPYRPGLGLPFALDTVRAGSGTQFDSAVVDACVEIFDSGFTFSRLAVQPLVSSTTRGAPDVTTRDSS